MEEAGPSLPGAVIKAVTYSGAVTRYHLIVASGIKPFQELDVEVPSPLAVHRVEDKISFSFRLEDLHLFRRSSQAKIGENCF